MKILLSLLFISGLVGGPSIGWAQGKAPAPKKTAATPGAGKAAVAKAGPAAPADEAAEVAAPIALAPETPAADPKALKIRADINPTTNFLVVRTDAPGPTSIEVNDAAGRPVITRNVIAGNKATDLNVSQLPAGYYVVRCTAGERNGLRRVRLGN